MSMNCEFFDTSDGECSWCGREKEVVTMTVAKGPLTGQQALCWVCLKKAVKNATKKKSVPVAVPSPNDNKAGAVKSL
jgi:hypothetical protein